MKKIIFLFLIGLYSISRLFSAEPKTRIAGRADFLKAGDTILLSVSPYAGRLSEIKSQYSCTAGAGSFEFLIPAQERPEYVRLQFSNARRYDLPPLLVFPGDNLDFRIRRGLLYFEGSAAARFEVQQELLSLTQQCALGFRTVYRPDFLAPTFNHLDSCAVVVLKFLEGKKSQIGEACFERLSQDIYTANACAKLGFINYACLHKPLDIQESFRKALKTYGKTIDSAVNPMIISQSGRPLSGYATEFIYQQYLVDSCAFAHRHFDLRECYNYESSNFSGEIRSQLVTELFIMKRTNPDIAAADIEHALGYIKDSALRDVLMKIKAINTSGSVAPDFKLLDAEGKSVSLHDFRGKLVLLDFWFTGCGACRQLAPRMRTIEKKYENRPVAFITISIDKSKSLWLSTLKSNLYTSPLSTNLYTGGKGDLHDVIKDFDVHGYPTIIMIDQNGRFAPKPEISENALSALIDHYL